ncbi:hypothetical protein [Vibrio rarus]|uniref:hypothetical protein n=1 Tax=Vibrio rarus TaxID=413403 RepID=UPI0021C33E12|nr:hypothetical protein [Vibrio rarus]
MYTLWAFVAISLPVAILNNGLLGSIAAALGFTLLLTITFKNSQTATKKSSQRMLLRIKPSYYDKVL